MKIYCSCPDFAPDGGDFLNGGTGGVGFKDQIDFGFLFPNCGMPEIRVDRCKSWRKCLSHAGVLSPSGTVPKIIDRILLLTDQEGVFFTTDSKRPVISERQTLGEISFDERPDSVLANCCSWLF